MAQKQAISRLRLILVIGKYIIINAYFRIYIAIFKYNRIKKKIIPFDGPEAPEDLSKWVGRMTILGSKIVPKTTCLSRAMTAQLVLKQKGYSSSIRIGVAKGDEGILAHAWLISNNIVIVGDENGELEKYKILTDMKAKKDG